MDAIWTIIIIVAAFVAAHFVFKSDEKGRMTRLHEDLAKLKAERKASKEAHEARVKELTKEVKNETGSGIVERFNTMFGKPKSGGNNSRPKRFG